MEYECVRSSVDKDNFKSWNRNAYVILLVEALQYFVIPICTWSLLLITPAQYIISTMDEENLLPFHILFFLQMGSVWVRIRTRLCDDSWSVKQDTCPDTQSCPQTAVNDAGVPGSHWCRKITPGGETNLCTRKGIIFKKKILCIMQFFVEVWQELELCQCQILLIGVQSHSHAVKPWRQKTCSGALSWWNNTPLVCSTCSTFVHI